MEILLLLYLAHLVGDYPLQTNWIYKQKIKSFAGGLWHMLDLLVAYLVCLAPFLYVREVQMSVALILVIHFFQDVVKVNFNKELDHERESYFVDQVLHFVFTSVIWWVVLAPIGHVTPSFGEWFYLSPVAIIYAIGLVSVTYFADVTHYMVYNYTRTTFKRNWGFLVRSGVIYSVIFWAYIYLS